MNKYNFKVSVNQFGDAVNPDYIDQDEILLLDKFEDILNNLKKEDKEEYKMIELGSNQCFYSLMFKSILGKERTTNYMVEPSYTNLKRGENEFSFNQYHGVFIKKSIGNRDLGFGMDNVLGTSECTVDDLIRENNIDNLDVLHCDIDGSEYLMLSGCTESLEKKTINYIILLTHGWSVSHPASNESIKSEFNLKDLHKNCLEHIKKYDYEILFETEEPIIGGDGLIIAKRK